MGDAPPVAHAMFFGVLASISLKENWVAGRIDKKKKCSRDYDTVPMTITFIGFWPVIKMRLAQIRERSLFERDEAFWREEENGTIFLLGTVSCKSDELFLFRNTFVWIITRLRRMVKRQHGPQRYHLYGRMSCRGRLTQHHKVRVRHGNNLLSQL